MENDQFGGATKTSWLERNAWWAQRKSPAVGQAMGKKRVSILSLHEHQRSRFFCQVPPPCVISPFPLARKINTYILSGQTANSILFPLQTLKQPPVMGKRKRGEDAPSSQAEASSNGIKNYHAATNPVPVHIQIITGSYDKVLHGCVATVSHDLSNGENVSLSVDFRDNFLFNAHTSAIRCLAISPVSGDARAPVLTLASGGSDERINLYQLSASVAPRSSSSKAPVELPGEAREVRDPRNKELGSLLHHASSITALCFPTRSKLLSGANDNTIAVSRARDWTVLSTFKAPIPKAVGRPSGDTAPLGGTPAGISDFAVHPSMKLMVSVGKGEKCMRLWNLVTGKKAGALSFGRETLRAVGEGKWGSGEARRVTWNSSGDEFAIAFEHGVVIYGMVSS